MADEEKKAKWARIANENADKYRCASCHRIMEPSVTKLQLPDAEVPAVVWNCTCGHPEIMKGEESDRVQVLYGEIQAKLPNPQKEI